jgi:cell division control protein 42
LTSTSVHSWRSLCPLSYPQTDVFLICFSLNSLQNIRDKWVPKILPDVPFTIVVTQINMRDDLEEVKELAGPKQHLISSEKLTHDLGAAKYLEYSSLTRKGLDGVFHEVYSSLQILPNADSPMRLLSRLSSGR